MSLLIKPKDKFDRVDPAGLKWSLEELQKLVGGYIELIYLRPRFSSRTTAPRKYHVSSATEEFLHALVDANPTARLDSLVMVVKEDANFEDHGYNRIVTDLVIHQVYRRIWGPAVLTAVTLMDDDDEED